MARKGAKRTKVAKVKKIPGQQRLKGITGKVKPSPQDLLIAKNLAEGKKKGEALIGAGVSPGNAKSNSAEILARPGVQAAIKLTMQGAGITTELIAQKLREGLSATKVISANLLLLSSDRPDEIIDATVIAESDREKALIRVEDFPVRHRYLETSCKLLDLFPRDGSGPQGGMDPAEEHNLIAQAEQEAGKHDTSRYFNS